MNYDRIILELMSRVQNLEEQLVEVKNELAYRKDEDFEELDNEQEEFTRSQARDKAIKTIQSKFPDYLVEKASRKEGSGIKVIKSDKNSKKAIIIKFYHSKIHEHKGGLDHAWHTINLDEIIGSIYDFCLFSVVDKNGDWNFFIYEPDELGFYRDENRSTNSELFHLYFSIKDGKAIETRENNIDVTEHLNNWHVLK